MDTEDDVPIKPPPTSTEPAALESPEQNSQPGAATAATAETAPVATATDVALEQDA